MTKNKFINGVADQTTVRTNDSLYKYNAEKNIWLINRLSKTVDISDYKDDIINNIENKLGTVTASSLGLFEGDALLVPEDFFNYFLECISFTVTFILQIYDCFFAHIIIIS